MRSGLQTPSEDIARPIHTSGDWLIHGYHGGIDGLFPLVPSWTLSPLFMTSAVLVSLAPVQWKVKGGQDLRLKRSDAMVVQEGSISLSNKDAC